METNGDDFKGASRNQKIQLKFQHIGLLFAEVQTNNSNGYQDKTFLLQKRQLV